MLAAFWRAVTGFLVFLGVFFYPFQFTASSQSIEYYPWQEQNQLTSKITATPPSSDAARQPAENKQPPAGNKEALPQAPLQPEETAPLLQQSAAENPPVVEDSSEPPPVEHPPIIKRAEVMDKVGISFDDGPYPGMTERYLDVLDQNGVKATFFMVGEQIKLYPELARSVEEQGSEIGSHSWRHDRLDQLEPEKVFADLQRVAEQVQETLGQETTLLRPPYGLHSEAVVKTAQELNQQVVLWDVDPRDWEDPSPEKIVATIMDQVNPGSIIVMHEGHENTLQALPEIIQKLRERDLEPISISELLN